MSVTKNQIRRIQVILKMLRYGSALNFTSFKKEMQELELAETEKNGQKDEYKLSQKTFLRDIDYLRKEYNAPIRYDRFKKIFELTNLQWYNEELMIEPFEMKSVLLGERAANCIFPDPMRGEISKTIRALLAKNEKSGMAENVEIESLQVLCPESLPKVKYDIFIAVYNAWEQRKYLKLVYSSATNHVTEKLFEPHVFAWNSGCWYIKGLLRRRKDMESNKAEECDPPEIQVLALHRIKEVTIIEGQFDSNPSILKRVKANGLFELEKIPEVKLDILNPAAQAMADGFADRIIERGDGYIRILLKDIPQYEAVRFIFSAYGDVRIVSPQTLKEYVCEIADKLLKNNA